MCVVVVRVDVVTVVVVVVVVVVFGTDGTVVALNLDTLSLHGADR